MVDYWQMRASEFHPYPVETIHELPDSLRGPALAAFRQDETFVRALVVPATYRSVGDEESITVPEQALVYTSSGVFHIRAPLEAEAAATAFLKPEALLLLRSSHLLLNGRLYLVGAVHGQLVEVNIEFNAMGWDIMELEWKDLVCKAIGLPSQCTDKVEAKGDHTTAIIEGLKHKFADGLRRYGLYTGETLLGTVFQKAVWSQQLLSLFEQQLVPNTLLALTNASVLLLAEESALVRESEQFGLIVTRIPRQAIAAIQSVTKDSLQEITFYLSRGGVTAEPRLSLDPTTATQWLELWAEYASEEDRSS